MREFFQQWAAVPFSDIFHNPRGVISALIRIEFLRFIFFAGINTLSTYLIYAALTLIIPYSIAYTSSYIAGIFISYFLYSRFVFQSAMSLQKFIQYPIVYIVQYLLSIVLLSLLVTDFSINKYIAPILVILISVPVTFILSRLIIKREPKVKGEGSQGAGLP